MFGFQNMDIHVHADETTDLFVTAGTDPGLIRDFGMVGKMLPAVRINGTAVRLAAIVHDLVRTKRFDREEELPAEGVSNPLRKPPGQLYRPVGHDMPVKVHEALMDGHAVIV